MAATQSVTNVALSPEDERKRRMVRYLLAMSLRVVCIVLGVYVKGWLMWVCFAGAIFLPYFAVVIANATGSLDSKAPKATAVVAPQLRIEASDFKVVERDDE